MNKIFHETFSLTKVKHFSFILFKYIKKKKKKKKKKN